MPRPRTREEDEGITRTSIDVEGLHVTNPDAERDERRPRELPSVEVEDLESMGTMIELNQEDLDPNFKYRWVNFTGIKMARAKAKGYSFVDPNSEEIRNAVGDSPEVKDGKFVVGDVVLMRCPRTTHAARRRRLQKKGERRLKAVERKFRREAEAASTKFSEPVQVITGEEGE